MQLIADANILFAALIKDSTTRTLILSDKLSLISPEFVIEEFSKHLEELSAKTSVSKEELTKLLEELINVSGIEIVSGEELLGFLSDAAKISPDPDDVQYFALALKYDCPIWSNEKLLKKQKVVKVLSTKELLEALKSW